MKLRSNGDSQHGLTASLTAAVNGMVTLTLAVTNTTSQSQTLHFPTSQQADFLATLPAGGAPVWHWAHGMSFAQMLGSVTLAPGDNLVHSVTWHAPRGSWLVTGRLTSTSHDAEATTIVAVP